MKQLLALAAALTLLCACQSVPSTSFKINPSTGVVSLDSPKDVHFDYLEATLPNGVHMLIKGYSSTNNPTDLAIVVQGNASMAGAMANIVQTVGPMIAKGVMAAPAPTNAPPQQP